MSDGLAAPSVDVSVDTSPVSDSPDVDTSEDSDTTETRKEPKVQAPKRDAEDSDDDGEEKPKKAPEKKPEPKPEPKPEAKKPEDERRKIKVDGKEIELTQGEIERRASLFSRAEEKFQEAASMRKEVESFVQQLKEKPLHILKQLGIDVRGASEEYLAEEVQLELMSPDERELFELRKWRQEQEQSREEAEMTAQEQAQQQQEQQARSQAQQFYDQKITEVLSQSNLPKTPYTVKRVATLLKTALTKGYELPIETAVEMVRGDFSNDVTAMAGALDGESLIKVLGPDIIKRLRKYDLDSIKARRAPKTPADIADKNLQTSQPRQRTETTDKKMGPEEWRDYIRKKAGL